MASRLEVIEKRVREFNLFFVAIALLIYAFSRCVFPAFFEMAKSIGTLLPDPFLFFCYVFEAIGNNPLPYFIGCSIYYGLTLRLKKPALNTSINLLLLLIFGLILLLFSGPFKFVGQ